jgi:hypothetical protein
LLTPVKSGASYLYYIKIIKQFRGLGTPGVVIFTFAACKPACNNGCGPAKMFDTPVLKLHISAIL